MLSTLRMEKPEETVVVPKDFPPSWSASPPLAVFTRLALFPKFDRDWKWGIRRARLRGKHFGHPDFERRTIWLGDRPGAHQCPGGMADLIAHAASGSPEHDKLWKAEMVGAVYRARARGLAPLAAMLEDWIDDQYGMPGFSNEQVLYRATRHVARR